MFLCIKHRFRKNLNIRIKKLSGIPNEYICISFFNEYLYREIRVSNMWYAYFMLIIDISGDLLQNNDNVYCVTGLKVITGPSFITQDRRSDLQEFFGNSVE